MTHATDDVIDLDRIHDSSSRFWQNFKIGFLYSERSLKVDEENEIGIWPWKY